MLVLALCLAVVVVVVVVVMSDTMHYSIYWIKLMLYIKGMTE